MVSIDFSNFFTSTVANYTPFSAPNRAADFVSESGSAYWDLGHGVVRQSNHWGTVASCRWAFDADLAKFPKEGGSVYKCGSAFFGHFGEEVGYCAYSDFLCVAVVQPRKYLDQAFLQHYRTFESRKSAILNNLAFSKKYKPISKAFEEKVNNFAKKNTEKLFVGKKCELILLRQQKAKKLNSGWVRV